MSSTGPVSHVDQSHGVVRKPLDEDCLLDGDLHPSIADRLSHVRDLPVAAVASLRAVERDANGAILVWQYLEGVTLEEYLAQNHDFTEIERLRRELKSVVEAMHAHGIVHGAIHGRNVIIDPQNKVRLTHVSPLLYSDPQQDLDAVEGLFKQFPSPPRTHVLSDTPPCDDDRKLRRRAYLAAAASVLVGILMFVAILWYNRM